MTFKRALSITGLDIRKMASVSACFPFCFGAFDDDGDLYCRSESNEPEEALEMLVDKCYRKTCTLVRLEQGYRCFRCGRIVPLENDHIVPRSHGRNDRRENCRALCPRCHEYRHGHPREDLVPSVEVVAAVLGFGWEWGGTVWLKITPRARTSNDSNSRSSSD